MSPWRERSTVQTVTDAGSMISTTSVRAAARRSQDTPTVRTGPAGEAGGVPGDGAPTASARRA